MNYLKKSNTIKLMRPAAKIKTLFIKLNQTMKVRLLKKTSLEKSNR